jgi:hypothetical protein
MTVVRWVSWCTMGAAASAAVLSLGGAWAYAAPGDGTTGTLTFQPASGLDSAPLTAVSTGVCSDPRGTNLQLRVSGAGFPPDTNVTPNLKASIYPVDPSTGGYDVPLQDTLQDFAAQQTPAAKLAGRYEFTLVCKKPLGRDVFQSYVGSLVFSSPTHFTAVAAAGTAATTTPSAATTPPASRTSPKPAKPGATSRRPSPSAHPTATVTRVAATPTSSPHPTDKPAATPAASTTTPSIVSASATPRPARSSGGAEVGAVPPTETVSPSVSVSQQALPAASPSVTTTAVAVVTSGRRPPGAMLAFSAVVLAVVILLGLVLRRRVSRGASP